MSDLSSAESFAETYLQISPNILATFPKFRPPVSLYVFDPELANVRQYHKAEERLSTERQAEVAGFARDGRLYLLRQDYRVYAEHLSKKLGLVLVEEGFSVLEVAEIFFLAFRRRVQDFFDQPKTPQLDSLKKDISILAEYLWIDPGRAEVLTRTLDREYSLAVHAVNTMFIGLALYTHLTEGAFERTDLSEVGLGLILHDLGMTNVPRFITDKSQFLLRRDRESIEKHIEAGESMLRRLKVDSPLVLECVRQHHERLDGSGYPLRKFDDTISMVGKLCGLADSFSAMISQRPYHDAKAMAEAAISLARDDKRYDARLAKMLASLLLKEQGAGETV